MAYLTNRIITPEHMDNPAVEPAEQKQSLDALRRMNRHFGGSAAAIGHLSNWLDQWPRDRPIRILDVGTGLADIPVAIVRWAKRRQIDVAITAIDNHQTTLAIAREFIGDCSSIELAQVDALALADHFEPGSFDIAHSAMCLHHFEDIEVITILRMMDRLSTYGVIWNDLVRRTISHALARLTCGARHLREDAIASVRAGFTKREALDLAARAGLSSPRYRTHKLYRFTLTSEH